MNERVKVITQAGYNRLQDELDNCRLVRRPEVAERLKVAVGFGDLAENAEYDSARIEQSELEAKILQIQDTLATAIVAKVDATDLSKVAIGLTVEVIDELNENVKYTMVGDGESDLDNFKLSTSSPVGKALLGKKVGALVDIQVPDGNIQYKILGLAYEGMESEDIIENIEDMELQLAGAM